MTTIKTNSNCNALPVSSLESKHCIFESIILNRKRKEGNTLQQLAPYWSGPHLGISSFCLALPWRVGAYWTSNVKEKQVNAVHMPPIDLFKNYELCCIVLLGRLRRGSACNCNQSATVPYLALGALSLCVCFEYLSSTSTSTLLSMWPMWNCLSNRRHVLKFTLY